LSVNGFIGDSAVLVNTAATLAGNGVVGTTIVAGGTLAPGNNSIGTLAVQGSLTLSAAATYLVQVSPTTASRTNVTGTASLAGTVQAQFSSGSYVAHSYTIVSALGRLGNFDALTTSGLPAGFAASLSYDNNDAFLNLTAVLGQQSNGQPVPTTALNQNQRNVANGLNNFFNSGGTLTPGFGPVFGLTGPNLANALSSLSGEAATGAPRVAFEMSNQFMLLMLDPFTSGRGGNGVIGAPAGMARTSFAQEPEPAPFPPFDITPELKAPEATSFDRRWSSWGGGFGGYSSTGGNTVVGSNTVTGHEFGAVAGADFRITPNAAIGFALAGGGTAWGLAQGLGGGRSDAFQAGIYTTARAGEAYIASAFAFTNHWMSTDRVAFAGDHLTANFDARNFAGRIETGYRFGTPTLGLTPYAAGQAQAFYAPAYSESDVGIGGFGLSYNAKTATDLRSEVGARFDTFAPLGDVAGIVLRARAAWAHDWVSDPSLLAVFAALPGASFTVTGAVPPPNSALASVSAELQLTRTMSLLAKFDGQFASQSTTYAGTGTVRMIW
jgi:uncharacterized protein with beta-barrel porin domain